MTLTQPPHPERRVGFEEPALLGEAHGGGFVAGGDGKPDHPVAHLPVPRIREEHAAADRHRLGGAGSLCGPEILDEQRPREPL